MAAVIEIENDAGTPITSVNFGAINGGSSQQLKFILKNTGTESATSVQLSVARLASNDGIDYASIAEDFGGNPGAFGTDIINVGTMIAEATKEFWVKVAVLTGTTPAGNPRNFNINCEYTGI